MNDRCQYGKCGYCHRRRGGWRLLLCILDRHDWEREGYWYNTPTGDKAMGWVDKCRRCRAACEVNKP